MFKRPTLEASRHRTSSGPALIAKVGIGLSFAITASAQEAATSPPGSETLEEVVVSGYRASLVKAADRKRNSDSIQDSIVAEDLGKMPDQNVAESLQRITGVSISRSGGEGSRITIRGFGPQFNVVKMNDRTLATTGTDRSFDFAGLPSELISGADVIKSPTAKLSSGSIGGFVNLHSARPLDTPGFHLSGSVNTRYQDVNEKFDPEASVLLSNTFSDDTFGALLALSYKSVDNRIDAYQGANWGEYGNHHNSGSTGYGFPLDRTLVTDENGNPTTLAGSRGPGRLRYTMNVENRKRVGANLALQWAPSENLVSTLDALYSKLETTSSGSGLQVASQEDWYSAASVDSRTGTLLTATQSNSPLEYLIGSNDTTGETEAFGYNLVFTTGNLTLAGDLSYSKATSVGISDNATALRILGQPNSSISFDLTHGDVPSLTLQGFNLLDPNSIRLHWQDLNGDDSEDEVKEAKFDAKYAFESGVVKSLETGIGYANRKLLSNSTGVHYNPAGAWPGAVMYFEAPTDIVDTSIFRPTPSNFLEGIGGNFPRQWLTPGSANSYRNASQAVIEAHPNEVIWGLPRTVALTTPSGRWDYLWPSPGNITNEEKTKSAYLQANLGGDFGGEKSWTANVGVRYVKTDNETFGFATTIGELTLTQTNPVHNAAQETYAPTTVSSSDDFFLPSLNLSVNLDHGNYVRFGAAKTITRPRLSDSSATYEQHAGFASPVVNISGANPYLKPYQVKSLDLSFEHYSENGSAYSLAYFFKDITSFIDVDTVVGVWDGPVQQALLDAYAAEGIHEIRSSTVGPVNRKGGTVQGVEFSALHNFDNLPGIWSGLGIQANYTYATSKDKDFKPINQPLVAEPDSALPGFAKNSYNVIAFYDKDAVEIRLGYNYTGNYLVNRSGDGVQPRYTAEFGELDFSASYDINDNVSAFFAANNLTDEARVDYLSQRERVEYVEATGRRFQLGVRAKF